MRQALQGLVRNPSEPERFGSHGGGVPAGRGVVPLVCSFIAPDTCEVTLIAGVIALVARSVSSFPDVIPLVARSVSSFPDVIPLVGGGVPLV